MLSWGVLWVINPMRMLAEKRVSGTKMNRNSNQSTQSFTSLEHQEHRVKMHFTSSTAWVTFGTFACLPSTPTPVSVSALAAAARQHHLVLPCRRGASRRFMLRLARTRHGRRGVTDSRYLLTRETRHARPTPPRSPPPRPRRSTRLRIVLPCRRGSSRRFMLRLARGACCRRARPPRRD